MEQSYDALVIGSGFGGGVTACRLAEAGWKVCVLERGRRFGRDDFPERPDQAPGLLWHPKANPGGMFDLRLMRDVAVITAAGVGGGSLVYASVQLRAPAEVFDAGWPEAIDRPTLDPWYDRTEVALEPVPTPDEPPLRKLGGRRARQHPAPAPQPQAAARPLPRPRHTLLGQRRRARRRVRPACPGLERAEMHIGPVMTGRIDYWSERRFMVADGALPEAFSGLLDVVRGANALTGWRRHVLL